MEFYYTSPAGEKHGPYAELDVLCWWRESRLPSSLLVQCRKDAAVVYEETVASLVSRNGRENPFLWVEQEKEQKMEEELRRLTERVEQLEQKRKEEKEDTIGHTVESLTSLVEQLERRCKEEKERSAGLESLIRQMSMRLDGMEKELNKKKKLAAESDCVVMELQTRVEAMETRRVEDQTRFNEVASLVRELRTKVLEMDVNAKKQGQKAVMTKECDVMEARNSIRVDELTSVVRELRARVDGMNVKKQGQKAVTTEEWDDVMEMDNILLDSVAVLEARLRLLSRLSLRDPLIDADEDAQEEWKDDACELNQAMQKLRARWSMRRAGTDDALNTIMEDRMDCVECEEEALVFGTAAQTLVHAISVEHVRNLRTRDGPGYTSDDVNYWSTAIVLAEDLAEKREKLGWENE